MLGFMHNIIQKLSQLQHIGLLHRQDLELITSHFPQYYFEYANKSTSTPQEEHPSQSVKSSVELVLAN